MQKTPKFEVRIFDSEGIELDGKRQKHLTVNEAGQHGYSVFGSAPLRTADGGVIVKLDGHPIYTLAPMRADDVGKVLHHVTRRIEYSTAPSLHKCDWRCARARGSSCQCSCRGANHGRGDGFRNTPACEAI